MQVALIVNNSISGNKDFPLDPQRSLVGNISNLVNKSTGNVNYEK